MGEEMIDRLLEELDLVQKVRLLSGATTWRTAGEPTIGLREMVTSDGPAGVRGEAWDERLTSALLPSASAIGALWDEGLIEELGGLLASEAVRKGVDVVLAPTLNLHRTPLGGRHFECFSEDPVLTGRTGAALIRGIQAAGVAATAKHYVANDSETGRMHVDVRVSEQVLREVYLAPFKAAVEAGVWLVMAGYNGVNGATMTASPLLADPLKGDWGFDGVVVSDWGALRSTREPALAALDLAMPGPQGPWEASLVRAVQDGHVPDEAIDEKVRRLLRLAGRVGALEPDRRPRTAVFGPDDTRALLRRTVAAGCVLLTNREVLPLDPASLAKVAVIGVHAASPRVQGGGSAGVFPSRVVTPLDGIRARLDGLAQVVHVPGPGLGVPPMPLGTRWCSDPRSGEPGVLLRLLDEAGQELHAEHRLSGTQLEPPVGPSARTVEISALIRPPTTGEWTFAIAGFGRMSLTLGDRTVLDGEFPCTTDDPAIVHVNPPRHTARATLDTPEPVLLTARRQLVPGAGRATIVAAAPPEPEPADALAEAVRAARDADVVIVVVGTTEHTETEGHDRSDLSLGGHQDALVRAVAAVNRRTIAVVNSGGPVELPWHDEVGALLLTWFPGQEAGAGLADVLFGDAEPGGRLPTTWAAALADAPVSHAHPVDGLLAYGEGVHIGHRAWLLTGREPAYWFGHGLGYTTWEYGAVQAPDEAVEDSPFTVRVQVRNTGSRPGREVVQVYLARPQSTIERPVRWFAGYAAVHAEPGASVTALVKVPAHALRTWSEAERAWITEPGAYQIMVGRSADDLVWKGALPLRGRSDTRVERRGDSRQILSSL
ncbi:glycoside hydrolase family 3 C-terminal domain-containing protein [Streptomyces sp. NPDC048383]|uniref:glycoside hydrolase family 3 C-terminal domain-containing protein n=1 Tax=Streptomyces sp. NPDC048383 TaxID=3155386 RepID=UPI00341CD97A